MSSWLSHPTVKLNGNKLVLMYQRLPEYKGPYSTLLALIRNIPDEFKARRNELEDKLFKYEVLLLGTIPWRRRNNSSTSSPSLLRVGSPRFRRSLSVFREIQRSALGLACAVPVGLGAARKQPSTCHIAAMQMHLHRLFVDKGFPQRRKRFFPILMSCEYQSFFHMVHGQARHRLHQASSFVCSDLGFALRWICTTYITKSGLAYLKAAAGTPFAKW